MQYYTINKFSKIVGKTAQTLRNWDKDEILKPHHTGKGGYRYYSHDQINIVLNIKEQVKKQTIGYCRVSSHKQKDELQRQIENMKTYLLAKGEPFEIITDVGSGINYNRKGLRTLINKIIKSETDKIVVLYKDRLLRFGFELLEYIADLYNCKIEIVDNSKKTDEEEFVEDIVQIITVFSCKLKGKRANRAKQMIMELISDDNRSQSQVNS